MSNSMQTLITAAIKELPAKSKTRAALVEAMKVRADYAARGRLAAKTRKAATKGKKSKKAAK